MRTFVQLQFAELRRSDLPAPLRLAGKSWPSLKPSPIRFSIGSPETDRGPPSS